MGIPHLKREDFEKLFPVFSSSSSVCRTPASSIQIHWRFLFGYPVYRHHSVNTRCRFNGHPILLFSPIFEHFGTLTFYQFCMFPHTISCLIVPCIDFLPPSFSMVGVCAAFLVRITFAILSYPCNEILLTNAAPSLLVLGTISSIAASTASLCRVFGPTITGLIYTQGVYLGIVGLARWVNAGVVCSVVFSALNGRGRFQWQPPN